MAAVEEELLRLCEYCSAIIPIPQAVVSGIDKPEKRIKINHHKTVYALDESAENSGCPLCGAIQRLSPLRTKDRYDHLDPDSDLQGLKLDLWLVDGHDETSVGDFNGAKGVAWVRLECEISSKTVMIPAGLIEYSMLIATCVNPRSANSRLWRTSKSKTMTCDKQAQIKSWLAECEANHDRCHDARSPELKRLPKRLVKVTDGSIEEGLLARLVLSTDESVETIRYIALSHCWGSHLPIRTTRENLALLSKNIPITSMDNDQENVLPRTFREALQLCASLEIHYIWIDALCIVQDDHDEWTEEAAHMKDVYSNATLTISASSAIDGSHGCFIDRPPSSHMNSRRHFPDILRFNVVAQTGANVLNEQSDGSCAVDTTIIGVRVYESVSCIDPMWSILSERGWTLQEQILSRRTVHCLYPEIHWQCCSTYKRESGVTVHVDSPSYRIKTFAELQSLLMAPGSKPVSEILRQPWQVWMEYYADRSFTFKRDWFAGLAGLLEQYGQLSGNTHVLGCWEEFLCTELGWHSWSGLRPEEERIKKVPSWSWISRSRDIFIDYWNMRESEGITWNRNHADLVEKRIVWEGRPLFSKLLCAELVLEAPIKEFVLQTPHAARAHFPPFVDVDFDIRQPSSEKPIPWVGSGVLDEVPEGRDTRRLNGRYTCLLLKSTWPQDESKLFASRQTFLIIERCQQKGGQYWKRIGLGGVVSGDTYFYDAQIKVITLV